MYTGRDHQVFHELMCLNLKVSAASAAFFMNSEEKTDLTFGGRFQVFVLGGKKELFGLLKILSNSSSKL